MARYIDADALKERLKIFSKWCRDGRKQGVDFVLDCPLPDMPTVDVVHVVRCKDCKYKVVTSDGEYNPTDIVCDYHASDGFDSNDFCSYGENADANSAIPTPDPAASLKNDVEALIYKLERLLCHATGGLLSKHTYDIRTMESAVNDYVEKCCDEARDETSSEVERLGRALAEQEAEYDQALQDKARECNIAIDKICLEHREKIRALQEKHEAELAVAKREFAREIFWEIDMLLTAIYLDDEDGTHFVGVDIQKYHALRKEINKKL